MAGPGRYVLSSCRGTQLANDATVDNGTSFFTQHLVDGLLSAADHDADGYVGFSDLYAYVDRQLREAGKQIPARRVDGDGDLRLAKRPRLAAVRLDSGPTERARGGDGGSSAALSAVAASPAPSDVDGSGVTAPPARSRASDGPPSRWRPRRVLALAVIAVVAGGVGAGALLRSDFAGGSSEESGTYTAAAPWRLRVDGTGYGEGCTVTLTNVTSGNDVPLPGGLYGVAKFQVAETGHFRWRSDDRRCRVTPFAGTGNATLPLLQENDGDTDAITVTAGKLAFHVVDNKDSNCTLRLFDTANGQELDIVEWEPGDDDGTLDPADRRSVYLYNDNCVVRVSAKA